MASLATEPSKEGLPSIDNFDFDKFRFEATQGRRVSIPGFKTIGGGVPQSPTSMSTYSIPPPPYSAGGSKTQSLAGYMSPVQSASRRSTRDEKESLSGTASLPSLSEALKSTDVPSSNQPLISTGTFSQTMSDCARGPGNPFSQPVPPISTRRPQPFGTGDASSIPTLPPPPLPPDSRGHPSAITSSPRLSTSSHQSSTSHPSTRAAPDSLFPQYTSRHSANFVANSYPDYGQKPNLLKPPPIKHKAKEDLSFSKPAPPRPYSETIKRHLEVYDAELALKELMDSSSQTHQFASEWTQRYHRTNRTSYINEGLPGTADVDDMLHIAHKMLNNLNKLRDVSIAQETAINEQRARSNQGQSQENDTSTADDVISSGFAGGDAKKRRGKAAPPGRCHSCNRAETPEWRRGPDGARTLCNACGLHYAKLTRKVGAKSAAVMTGSNLRPKGIVENHG